MLLGAGLLTIVGPVQKAPAQQASAEQASATDQGRDLHADDIRDLLQEHCFDCHGAERQESGIRLDRLSSDFRNEQLRLWRAVRRQIESGAMPPEDLPPINAETREALAEWILLGLEEAGKREPEKHGSLRRLTIEQYGNVLGDLLGIEASLTDALPPDAPSKDGFLNDEATLALSPLLLESYLDVAKEALDLALVDPQQQPAIQVFEMQLGKGINSVPCPDPLILGANSHLLANEDFIVSQPVVDKPFPFTQVKMRTQYRFIEGYQGNDTVRDWREYDSIYHSVFACMRGSEGYPKGLAYQSVPEGLLLRPAIPSNELFQVESTYGPRANFKISLRELPDEGRFRVTVRAAKYADALLLSKDQQQPVTAAADKVLLPEIDDASGRLSVQQAGLYVAQINKPVEFGDGSSVYQMEISDRYFSARLVAQDLCVLRLNPGVHSFAVNADKFTAKDVCFLQLDESHAYSQSFLRFEERSPHLGVHVGLRRDCGSTLTQVGQPQDVSSTELADFVFEDWISDYPSPDVEKDNVNYLAGIREIGVRSEYTDGRDMPRLLIHSVRFEGPYFDAWPPQSHQQILTPQRAGEDAGEYARRILRNFATKAYRRPATDDEVQSLFAVWRDVYEQSNDNLFAIRQALVVALTSPQFLFIAESSASPDAEPISEIELAIKLAFFLWNSAPDEPLLQLAKEGELRSQLSQQFERMLDDPRAIRFLGPFVSQWLRLDKFAVVELDRTRYPDVTRALRRELAKEPIEFVRYLVRENLSAENLIDSDFIIANEVVANYYGLETVAEQGFDFVPVAVETKPLGGFLGQAAILAGLSDGREGNAIKRGAWFARSMLAEPPDDPPPNVPALPEGDDAQLTLREKLERHRDQPGCNACHRQIDPWGIPFEQFDASGRWKQVGLVDAAAILPDNTAVDGIEEFKRYLLATKVERVAYSFVQHATVYAVGRRLSYRERTFLEQQVSQLAPQGYPLRDLLKIVIDSPAFLEK